MPNDEYYLARYFELRESFPRLEKVPVTGGEHSEEGYVSEEETNSVARSETDTEIAREEARSLSVEKHLVAAKNKARADLIVDIHTKIHSGRYCYRKVRLDMEGTINDILKGERHWTGRLLANDAANSHAESLEVKRVEKEALLAEFRKMQLDLMDASESSEDMEVTATIEETFLDEGSKSADYAAVLYEDRGP